MSEKSPRRTPQIAADQKAFSIIISSKAHKNLRHAAEHFEIGQNYLLTFLLEDFDLSVLRPRIDAYHAQRHETSLASKVTEDEAKAFLRSLTPAQRKKLIGEV